MMFLVIILILVVGYYLIRHTDTFESKHTKGSNAEEILKQRYVAGEIDEETYIRMLKAIRI